MRHNKAARTHQQCGCAYCNSFVVIAVALSNPDIPDSICDIAEQMLEMEERSTIGFAVRSYYYN